MAALNTYTLVHVAILLSSIHSTDIHETILIYLSHLINVRQEKCVWYVWELPARLWETGAELRPSKKCISFPSTHIIIVSFQSDWKAVDLRVVVIFHLILNTAKNL